MRPFAAVIGSGSSAGPLLFGVAVAVAIVLSLVAATGSLLPGDLRIAHGLQPTPGGGAFERASDAVYLARFPVFALAALVTALRRRYAPLLAAVLVLLSLALNPALKHLIERARPAAADHVTIREAAGGYGFPSGHAMTSMLLYGYVAAVATQTLARRAAAFAAVVAAGAILLVGWDRVYNGAHWPSDVLGGWAIGAALLMLSLTAATAFVGPPHVRRAPVARPSADARHAGR